MALGKEVDLGTTDKHLEGGEFIIDALGRIYRLCYNLRVDLQ